MASEGVKKQKPLLKEKGFRQMRSKRSNQRELECVFDIEEEL